MPGSATALSLGRALQEFFTVHFGTYEYVKLDGLTVGVSIAVACLVLLAAELFVAFRAGTLADFVNALKDAGADSPETAVTLRDLGFEKNPFARSTLAGDSLFTRCVLCVEKQAYEKKLQDAAAHQEKTPEPRKKGKNASLPAFRIRGKTLSGAHFYLPEDNRHLCEVRFCDNRTGPFMLAGILVGTVAACLILLQVLPTLVGWLDELIGLFK